MHMHFGAGEESVQVRKSATIVSIAMLALVVLSAFSAATTIGPTRPLADEGGRDGVEHHEVGDESHNHRDAVELESGDIYFGQMDRVADRSDHFEVTAAQHQVVNVRIRVMGHDGIDEWVRPPTTTPPSPPDPVTASCLFNSFIYHQPTSAYPLDGVLNYYYVRDYVLNICAPVPGTHAYSVNVSLDWRWTPNNYTWDYRLDVDVSAVPELTPTAWAVPM